MAYYRNYKKYTGKKADKNLTEDPKCYSYWLTKEKQTVTGLYINSSVTLEYYKREILKIVAKVLTVPNAFTKQDAYDNFVFNIKKSDSKAEVYDYCKKAMERGEQIPSGNLLHKPATI